GTTRPSSCSPDATLGWPPVTPPTSSARIGNCWTCCGRANMSSSPETGSAQRRQVEHRARGGGGRCESSVWRVLGGPQHSAAVFGDHLQRLVDIVSAEVDRPV